MTSWNTRSLGTPSFSSHSQRVALRAFSSPFAALPEVLGDVPELPGVEPAGIRVLDRAEERALEAHGQHAPQVVLAERGRRDPLRDLVDGDALDVLDHPARRLGRELEPLRPLPHALDVELPLVEETRVGVVDGLVRRPVEAAPEHPREPVVVEELLVDGARDVVHADAELLLKKVPRDHRGAGVARAPVEEVVREAPAAAREDLLVRLDDAGPLTSGRDRRSHPASSAPQP